jgi:NAD(P)-dependent dehydrogenase (short-subunit alcohol dehydrogenase family)
MRLAGRVAIITGAAQGIGRAYALRFAREGAHVVVADLREEAARDVAAECTATGPEALAGRVDVADEASTVALAARTVERFGRIDVLINNASELGPSPLVELQDLDRTTLQDILTVNVVAPLHLIQQVLPAMRQQGSGLIVNVTSDAAVNAYPTWGGYGASKAALEHLSRILAAELEGAGIRVYVVDPGDMNTAMHEAAEPGVDLSHLPGPEAVAPAFVRLLDDPAPFARYEASALLATAV